MEMDIEMINEIKLSLINPLLTIIINNGLKKKLIKPKNGQIKMSDFISDEELELFIKEHLEINSWIN
jgi:hypothetical protein